MCDNQHESGRHCMSGQKQTNGHDKSKQITHGMIVYLHAEFFMFKLRTARSSSELMIDVSVKFLHIDRDVVAAGPAA